MALTVVLGAFGAHGLEDQLSTEAKSWWEVGVRYQAWHGLGLLILGSPSLSHLQSRTRKQVTFLLLIGIVLFSGSLYLMALGGPRWFGAVTPLGGLAWVVAWGLLGWRCVASEPSS